MADIMVNRPFHPLRKMRSEMDRLFGDVFRDRWGWEVDEDGSRMWTPQMDLSETTKEYLAQMDLPGMEKGDIKVKVEDHQLVVSGERKEEKREENENYLRTERRYGSFYRSFPLPDNVKSDGIAAEMEKGVLKVHIPKSEKSKAKEISVK